MPRKTIAKNLTAFALALMFLFSIKVPAFANEINSMELKNFYVDVWPEYDDPRVLVIYKGTFINNTGNTIKTGEKVYFNVPNGAEIGMACETDSNYGSHGCQPYETFSKGAETATTDDDYQVLSWRTTKDVEPGQDYYVFLEFYYNPIEGETDKTINYIFRPSAKINTMNLLIQQPAKATNFKLSPEAPTSGKSGEFTNYYYSYSNVKPEDNKEIKITYTKTDPKPSVEKAENAAGGTVEGGSQLGTSAWSEPATMIAGIFFVGLLGFFVYYALNNKPNHRAQRVKNKAKSRELKQQEEKNLGKTNKTKGNSKLIQEKKKIRQMLLNGEISEDTYKELIAELEDEYNQ